MFFGQDNIEKSEVPKQDELGSDLLLEIAVSGNK